MLRVRFHGRGGHGVKTASRILGTSAFQSGFQVQDFPVYGAERRGAAVAAYTRINNEPILERGIITQPDLIVVGDETLLADPGAGVLTGATPDTVVFVNTAADAESLSKYVLLERLVTSDITSLTLHALASGSTLSAGLAAVAARLIGVINEPTLLAATSEELSHLSLPDDVISQNLSLGREIFRQLNPAFETERGTTFSALPTQVSPMCRVNYDGPLRGAPSILNTANAAARHTGSWRVDRPEIDYDRCTRCGICFARCPDGAIALDAEGYPVIDYDHCKGCMICWDQCPIKGGIIKKQEKEA